MPLWNSAHLESCRFPTIKDFRRDKEYTIYVIEVWVDDYYWTVERRYSDFAEYDRKRFSHLKQSFLPPKKLLGNHDVAFLKQRLAELDRYLKTVFELEALLQRKHGCFHLPRLLVKFLDFNKYEVWSICEELAEQFSSYGVEILSSSDYYELSPLHLHAITERMKMPESASADSSSGLNFGNVLDFLHLLQNLKIRGSNLPYQSSNIIPNALEFSMTFFKSLKSLWITDCNVSLIRELYHCRQTVVHLSLHRCLSSLSEFVVDKEFCLDLERVPLNSSSQLWRNIKVADLSFNNISRIDKSVIFLRPVEILNLTGNRLNDIDYLQHLTHLTEIDLSHNIIRTVVDWHRKLGNIQRLALTANKLENLEGLSRLYSLERLDLRFNCLVQPIDLRPLSRLPCLSVLLTAGNPLDACVEYRSRALEEAFGDRAADARLDDQLTSQREMDAVGVRLAIRRANEERQRRLSACRDSMIRTLDATD